MAPKPKLNYGGGFNPQRTQMFAKIDPPKQAKCAGCKKTKLINGFSKKQQEILVHDLANKSNKKAPASPAIVRCRKCNGGVVQELLCSVCQIVKGLDAFTKFQRSQPDQARCIACVNIHMAEQPKEHEEDMRGALGSGNDDDDSDDDVTNRYGSDGEESAVGSATSSLNKMNLHKHNVRTDSPSDVKKYGWDEESVAVNDSSILSDFGNGLSSNYRDSSESRQEQLRLRVPKWNPKSKWNKHAVLLPKTPTLPKSAILASSGRRLEEESSDDTDDEEVNKFGKAEDDESDDDEDY